MRKTSCTKRRLLLPVLFGSAVLTVSALSGSHVLAAGTGEWRQEDGALYWYEDGVRQGYDPADPDYRGKEIYDPSSDAWYWLDNVQNGARAVSKDVYQESLAGDWGDRLNEDGQRIGKWVRYDENGHMVKGWSYTDAGAYYFDLTYGTMAKGAVSIDGQEYIFDQTTGLLQSTPVQYGWYNIGGALYWYEGGVRQGYDPADPDYRGKEIYDPFSNAWYWLDNVQNGARAVSKDVYQESLAGDWGDRINEDGQRIGKWVRYDENGHMIKGWSYTDAGTYYFDPTYGTMAKGRVQIDGIFYVFNQTTGVLEKPENECNLPEGSPYYRYEYAYRTKDLSGLSSENMPFYEAFAAYLDYALAYDTPFLQEKAIHNYMVLNCEYDYDNLQNNTIPWVSYSAEGVLVNRTAVCQGYALAFQMFMEVLDIPCETITSYQLNHAWNRVMLDGEWYMVDVTWDDPVPDQPSRLRFSYFNMPSRFFSGHDASDYTQTAEGTRWMGDAVYYLATDNADREIADILQQEIQLLNKERVIYFLVSSTPSLSAKDYSDSFNLYNMQYGNAYAMSQTVSGDEVLIRLTSVYDSYEDYRSQVIGDTAAICTASEAEEVIYQYLENYAPRLSSGTRLSFQITGENQDEDSLHDMISRIFQRGLLCHAYSLSVSVYPDKAVVQALTSGYGGRRYQDYADFLSTYLSSGKSCTVLESSYEDAADSIVSEVLRLGTGFTSEDCFALLIPRTRDGSWENNDPPTAINDLVQEIRQSHPYCSFYRYSTAVFEDYAFIRLNPSYSSFEEYQNRAYRFEITAEDEARERALEYCRQSALAGDWAYARIYFQTSAPWNGDNMDDFRTRVAYDKYGSAYSIYLSAMDNNWIMVSLSPFSEPEKLVAASFNCSESEAANTILQVLASGGLSSGDNYTFYVTTDDGNDWTYERYGSFCSTLPGRPDYDVTYSGSYRHNQLRLMLYP